MIPAASNPAGQSHCGSGMLGTKCAGAVRAHHELLPSVGAERHPILRGSRQPPVPLFAAAPPQELCPSRECRSRGQSYPCSSGCGRGRMAVLPYCPKPIRFCATIWWALLILNGAMPAASRSPSVPPSTGSSGFAGGRSACRDRAGVRALPIVNPIQTAVSMNLGNKVPLWLNEALIRARVSLPVSDTWRIPTSPRISRPGEFDRGMTGPPMYLNVDFIATSLVSVASGVALGRVVLIGFAVGTCWFSGGWGSTHWLLRDSGIWKDRIHPRCDRPSATPTMPTGWLSIRSLKELRLLGLAGWTVERHRAPQTAVRTAVPCHPTA